MREVARHGHNGWFGCQTEGCRYLPWVSGTRTRCCCLGWQTRHNGVCTACGCPVMEDSEWDALETDTAGFVESGGIRVKEMTETFPVTITAYRGTKAFKVYGVIEDSITSEADRNGNITLSFETLQSKNEIGYIPCVDWYTTEIEA